MTVREPTLDYWLREPTLDDATNRKAEIVALRLPFRFSNQSFDFEVICPFPSLAKICSDENKGATIRTRAKYVWIREDAEYSL